MLAEGQKLRLGNALERHFFGPWKYYSIEGCPTVSHVANAVLSPSITL